MLFTLRPNMLIGKPTRERPWSSPESSRSVHLPVLRGWLQPCAERFKEHVCLLSKVYLILAFKVCFITDSSCFILILCTRTLKVLECFLIYYWCCRNPKWWGKIKKANWGVFCYSRRMFLLHRIELAPLVLIHFRNFTSVKDEEIIFYTVSLQSIYTKITIRVFILLGVRVFVVGGI